MTTAEGFTFPDAPSGARIVQDPYELEVLFSENVAAHIYPLCDLEPPYWSHSRWYRRGDATVGIVGVDHGKPLVVSAVSTADIEGSNRLASELSPWFREGQLIIGSPGMASAIAQRRVIKWKTDELRYVLHQWPSERATGVEPLCSSDTPAIEELYSTEPGAAFFSPSMMSSNSFVGIWSESRRQLVAAAGTHVLSEQKRIAAIGAVFVRADSRGSSLGTQVTLGVLERLGGRVDSVGLNTSRDNVAARRIYERLGFAPILPFEEAEIGGLGDGDATK